MSGGGSPRPTGASEDRVARSSTALVKGPHGCQQLAVRCPPQRRPSRRARSGTARGTGGLTFGQTRGGGSNSRDDWVPSTRSGPGRCTIKEFNLGSGLRVRGAGAPGLGKSSPPSRSSEIDAGFCQTILSIKPQHAAVAVTCPRPCKSQGTITGSQDENEDGASGLAAEEECKDEAIHMPQRGRHMHPTSDDSSIPNSIPDLPNARDAQSRATHARSAQSRAVNTRVEARQGITRPDGGHARGGAQETR